MAAFESKKYSYRSGYSYKVPAQVVGKALESIEEKEGKVTSKSFLEYSRPETADTHSMFEWNDSIAAEKYRLRQSAAIIGQIEVKIEIADTDDGEPQEIQITPVPAFVNVAGKSTKASATFVNVVTAHEDSALWKQVLRNALAELNSFKRKYARYKEFAKVISAIDELTINLTATDELERMLQHDQ